MEFRRRSDAGLWVVRGWTELVGDPLAHGASRGVLLHGLQHWRTTID